MTEIETKAKEIIGVVGIIRKGEKYLLGLETKDSPFRGKWRLLGGKVEAGEKFEDTLVREIREEAQIEINIIRYLTMVVGEFRNIPIHVFLADWSTGTIKTKDNEHSKIELFTPEQVETLELDNMTRKMFERFVKVPAIAEM